MQIAERDGIALLHGEAADERFVHAIETTRFGGPSLGYYRHNVREQLDRLGPGDFFSLTDNGQVIGTYVLTPVDTVFGGERLPALYRSNLSVASTYRGRGLGRWLVDSALDWSREQRSWRLSFGSIEAGNAASLRTVSRESGIRLATLQNRLVYRQWGRSSGEVVVNPDASQVVSQLETANADCSLRFADPREGDYFAVCDDSQILAGARVHLHRLDIRDDGFSAGRFYAGLVKLFPPGRRRFDPADFRYLSVSDAIAVNASGGAWDTLVRHLVSRFGVHMLSFTLDDRSRLGLTFKDSGLFGRFSAMTQQTLHLVVRPQAGIALDLARETPVAIAPLDA